MTHRYGSGSLATNKFEIAHVNSSQIHFDIIVETLNGVEGFDKDYCLLETGGSSDP